MDWGALGVALVSGVVSGVVVAWVADYLQGERRKADVREARRNQAARIVGPALASLRDLEPEANVGVLRGHPDARDALKQKWDAWLAASGELEVLGATHPDTAVAEHCELVITKGTQLLGGVQWAVQTGEALADGEWERLKRLHRDALADGRQLVLDVLDQPAS
jgi:hypothetical protein